MSMSISVTGFRPPDEKWKKMKTIWDACDKAGVRVPTAVTRFFGGNSPDDAGVEVDLDGTACCNNYREEMEQGFEIEVAKLPKDVKVIRFVVGF